MGDGSVVHAEDVPELVYQGLVDEFGESQDRKVQGYVCSQSLRKLMEYLEPDEVVGVRAIADVRNGEETVAGMTPPGDAKYCIDTTEYLKTTVELDFDYGRDGRFPWSDILEFLDGACDVDDLAIRSLTVRQDNETLRNHLRRVLSETIGLHDTKYLKSPFFFHMRSRQAKGVDRDRVKTHNDTEFLKRVGYRVLDLNSVYSLRAEQSKTDPVMGIKPKELEDLALNFSEEDTKRFGATYSNLVVNKWRQSFSRTIAENRSYQWSDSGTWERVDMNPTGDSEEATS